MEELKKIRLIADEPFFNNVDIGIFDFGGSDGALRKRGKIRVDFAEYDIRQLKASGILTLEQALDHYKDSIYKIVRRYLLCEFQVDGGWEEILDLIKENIGKYYEFI